MKRREYLYRYQRFWAIGMTVALIMLGQFLTAGAQISKPKITIVATDDIFEQTLSQPTQFLQDIGIMQEEVQHELEPRARISVVGAGFARNLGLVAFTNIQNTQAKSSIQVEGAGATRVLRLAAFMEPPINP